MPVLATKTDRVSELICYFAAHCARAGRTQIVELLYLSDLSAREFFGKPLTDLDYILWERGPFDSRIYVKISELLDAHALTEKRGHFQSNGAGHAFHAQIPASLNKDEKAVIEYVVQKYGGMTPESLTRQVNRTLPMRDARKRKGRGTKLRMDLVDNSLRELFLGIKLGVEQLDRGDGIPFSEVLARLQ